MSDTADTPAMPPPNPKVYAYMKSQGMPGRHLDGMAGIGWFSDVPSPLTPASSLAEIHEYAAAAEAGSDYLFNLPNVAEYAAKLLEDVIEEELTIQGVDGNDIPIIINSPKGSTPKRAILFMHGGGMALLSAKSASYRAWARLLAKDGLVVASVDFRNSSGVGARAPFPAGLNDCVSALKWLGDREEIEDIVPTRAINGTSSRVCPVTCFRVEHRGWAVRA